MELPLQTLRSFISCIFDAEQDRNISFLLLLDNVVNVCTMVENHNTLQKV